MDIDETAPANLAPQPHHDEVEDIEVVLVEAAEMGAVLRARQAAGIGIDIKLISFCVGAGLRF
jgi:hypothetical protein